MNGRRLELSRHQSNSREARLKRLAAEIDALAEKDEEALRKARKIAATRRFAALELHRQCAAFALSINALLTHTSVTLDPPDYSEDSFREDSPNLFQLNVRGRILQVDFEATATLLSTEEFRVPYTLAGSIRAFNQDLLDRNVIEEQLLFYTVEKHLNRWRFFDSRTYRSGPFDEEYLVSLMERLL